MKWLAAVYPWIIFVPLFMLVRNKKPLSAFRYAYLYGLIYFGFLVYWIKFVTGTGLLFIVMYLALYSGIFGWLAGRRLGSNFKRFLPDVIFLPCLWVVLEFLRSNLFIFSFGWALVGYSETDFLPLIQIARLTGAYGVSFAVMAVNTAVFKIIDWLMAQHTVSKQKRRTVPWADIIVAAFIVAICWAYGFLILAKNTSLDQPMVRVGIVQGNIPQDVKWDEDSRDLIMEKYVLLSRLAVAEAPDVIIWPETSVPDYMAEGEWAYEKISGLAQRTKTEFLVGAPYSADGFIFNSAFLFSAGGQIIGRYDKLRLVPFGEYLPFADKLQFLEKYFQVINEVGDFSPGAEYTLFPGSDVVPLEHKHFAVLICFEDIFSDLVRGFVNRGANLLINVTNDAWFGYSTAPYQHLSASVFRAVENHRSVVRSANTGISCFIDPYGRVYSKVSFEKKQSDIFVPGYRVADVVLSTEETFYSKYGNIFVWACMLVTLTGVLGFNCRKEFKNVN